jgi:hypothetical protein
MVLLPDDLKFHMVVLQGEFINMSLGFNLPMVALFMVVMILYVDISITMGPTGFMKASFPVALPF